VNATSQALRGYAEHSISTRSSRRAEYEIIARVTQELRPFPKELKARIAYLAEFTNHQSRRILRNKASVMPLLEINMALLRGLKEEGPVT